jgi:hypothetical protein
MARLKSNKKLFIGECAKLILYFEAQNLWPRFWQKKSKAKDTGIHWMLGIIASLMRNGCTYEEAWTMPESEAIWLNMAHAQANGSDVQIVSETEWDAMQSFLAKQRQKEESEKQNPRAN